MFDRSKRLEKVQNKTRMISQTVRAIVRKYVLEAYDRVEKSNKKGKLTYAN